MTSYDKPSLTMSEIEAVLRKHFGTGATEITPMAGGNLSSVFSFVHEGKGYCVKFSDLAGAYKTERYVSDLLSGQGIPFPKCLALGKTGRLAYAIMERIEGRNLADCTEEEQARQLPDLMAILTRLAAVKVGATSGYGWIGPDGNGAYASWKDFVVAFNAEDQTGTFWENWHDLYRTSCLEKDVFEEIYHRLMDYVPYNESYRGFIHGDFHQWNILSDGTRITGIIDGNCMYGDFLVDLAILDRHMPRSGVVGKYQDVQAKAGIALPNFKERLLGAYYFKGLDGLRFYAKMGWKDAYQGTREFLLNLK
ncbi:aminoglycoside phosphotransferase family protein [Paenibacillus sp. MWE-103]|uniref:Aminoglycoside phosphotransferase family protein n=1 Tax=Paenibacillus artemisiicola TaxID=1172618 RepID=A0ABS3W7S1_9BACL|nr:aminoglycoside phosphotransferase family protein [Paenibacillus artemisiicola]MBO7744348.1 aminoglycoside phosphotransferase family protein [Paenibacillus artemisiicola]